MHSEAWVTLLLGLATKGKSLNPGEALVPKLSLSIKLIDLCPIFPVFIQIFF